MKYTTTEKIARRLRGRVEIPNGNLIPSASAQKVDPDLIEQVANQIESQIDLALSQIYILPIPLTAESALLIIEGIVEKLVVSEICAVHFQQSSELAGDSGFGMALRKQAIEQLQSILYGHGVYIPGLMPPPPPNPVVATFCQPLVLPGVDLQHAPPDTFSRSYSFVEQREVAADSNPFA